MTVIATIWLSLVKKPGSDLYSGVSLLSALDARVGLSSQNEAYRALYPFVLSMILSDMFAKHSEIYLPSSES